MEDINKKRKKKRDLVKIALNVLKVFELILFVLFEVFVFYFTYVKASFLISTFRVIYFVVKMALIFYIMFRKDSATYKLYWFLIITLIPIIGIIVYFIFGYSRYSKKELERIKKINQDSSKYLMDNFELLDSIEDNTKNMEFNYLYKMVGFPIYKSQGIEYLKTGEEFFESLIAELKNAKKYILIELYIISKGDLLDKILKILCEKANQGVRVKIIADSLGSTFKKPKKLQSYLAENKIELIFFNNNIFNVIRYASFRDHRKIIVIDGRCAYTGGINIADEYINVDEKYGYWKDGGIKLYGKPVKSYIVMFGRMYEKILNKSFNYDEYIKQIADNFEDEAGYVMSVEQSPENNKNSIEAAYVNAIYNAEKYIYIATPYLVLPESVAISLITAARKGVRVRIAVPGVPDKILVNKITKSFYQICLEAGIEIYEYVPGFIHSKLFLIDGNFCIAGSVNFDYRSFNLNYECMSIMYKTSCERKMLDDFNEIFENSNKINLKDFMRRPIFEKIIEIICRLFTPLV